MAEPILVYLVKFDTNQAKEVTQTIYLPGVPDVGHFIKQGKTTYRVNSVVWDLNLLVPVLHLGNV